MNIDFYLDIDTVIHRLDGRTKILLFLSSFVALVLFEDPLYILPIALLILLQNILARAWINIWRIRFLLTILTISSLIMWNVFASGETHLFWFVDYESLLYSFARTILILFMIISGMNLLSTTRNEELVLAMIKLGLPYRVGFAISTSLRMVPTISSSIYTISQAQRSRGLDLESGNIVERVRKYIPLLIPVFISTIRGTNVFGMALESKGFGARDDRTFYLEMTMSRRDYITLAFVLAVIIFCLTINFLDYGNIAGLTKF
ncbi:MAG: energy-coupling factor transporter transmembrane protein EcfT [Chloroflexi bacterium]|nr:MAG: energy-coupling factor transporter transmembrane protein EcfT [Chloroflexota bacterium]